MSMPLAAGEATVLTPERHRPTTGRSSLVLVDTVDRATLTTALLRHAHRTQTGRFHLLVPARWPSDALVGVAAHEGLTAAPTEDLRFAIGRWRLGPVVAELRAHGLDVSGDVELPAPLRVAGHVLASSSVDEVLLVGRGRGWSRRGTSALAHQLRRRLPVPVIEI